MLSVDELELDLHDLTALRDHSTRDANRHLLDAEIERVQRRIEELKRSALATHAPVATPSTSTTSATTGPLPTVKLINYGWDQSDKFVKIYITLNGIQNAPSDSIKSAFTEKSFSVFITNHEGKNYQVEMKDLLHPISVSDSQVKKKTDMLLVMLRKVSEGKQWSEITRIGADAKEKKTPKFNDSGDPQDSLMNMMKQMYDDGDDEMKKTIRKAWHESRSKEGGAAGLAGAGLGDMNF